MASDKEIIRALMNGLEIEVSRDAEVVDIAAQIEQSAVKIDVSGEGQVRNSLISDNYAYNEAIINFPIDLQAEAYVRLEELLDEIDNTGKNSKSIKDKFEWFRNNIPLIESVLSTTKAAQEIGLA